jgi:hypothetical protein
MRELGNKRGGEERAKSRPDGGPRAPWKRALSRAFRCAGLILAVASLGERPLSATSVIPISDAELYRRADVVVYGVVVASDVTVDDTGRPETLTFIEPIAVLKGQLSGSLVLHQAGGTLPDGRFFKLWGRPEYFPGREVVVFAIARAKGEYETAEMILGKFQVLQDEAGERFAVPDLAIGIHPGVEIHRAPRKIQDVPGASAENPNEWTGTDTVSPADTNQPRQLLPFLASVRTGDFETDVTGFPSGSLEPVRHETDSSGRAFPKWGNLADTLYRWNNNATAAWTLNGTSNIDGGGVAEATGATATWTNDPNSSINYSIGSSTPNVINLNATTSTLGCGWSTCLSGSGVIGCAGPTGLSGSNTWRGDTYSTITQGNVELRAYCTHNGVSSTLTQSVLTHELGHTLGLGHSDQNVSPHDLCRGDESFAIMRSVVQNYTYLGTDDQDAIRWIYGDGGNSCNATTGNPPTVTTTAASYLSQTIATLNGTVNPNGASTSANFQYGTSTTYGSNTATQPMGAGASALPVGAGVAGLTCGTLYHFRAVAVSTGGTGYGSDMTFTTSACAPPPAATTNAASSVTQTGATLNGSANPNGAGTTAYFQYGTTTSYGSATTAQSIGSGTSSVSVNQAISGLLCNTLYHFRIVASGSGTSYGADQTFTTSACSASGFYTVVLCRLVDTRNASGPFGGPALAAGADRTFTVAGQCGVPSTAKSIAANLTVTQPTAPGDLRLYAAGGSLPTSSSINYKAGKTRANNSNISLGVGGAIGVHSDQATGTVQVIIDVTGYYQ